MDITSFSEIIRLGQNFPSTIDVKPISEHEAYGVMAICYTYGGDKEQGFVQFRQHNRDKIIALFAFGYNDQAVPEYWKDSVVIWDSRKETPCDPTATK